MQLTFECIQGKKRSFSRLKRVFLTQKALKISHFKMLELLSAYLLSYATNIVTLALQRKKKNTIMAKALIESQITIDAPIQKVWDVLADFDQYDQWNPFTPKIETTQEIGSDVLLHVRLNPNKPKLTKQKETLLLWEAGKQMDWGIQSWWVQTVRTQKLTAIDDQTTQYYTSDAFEGFMTPIIMWLFRQKIQRGFDDVAKGLKTFVEKK